jgi:serine/threonine protein kinase/predicted ATPase
MRVGELLAQRFRIERPAGAGAMGSVFRACDVPNGGRWVAVKVLPGGSRHPRFEREVAALAGVDSDVVVRYVAHGRSDAGEAFVVMDWIEGQSLAERLSVSGLTGVESLVLAHRLTQGLAALHAGGVVHRDLKPSNVMLSGGRVEDARIVDLGIARLASDGPDLTSTGTHLGTPRYMAPEQIRDPHAVDGRADVFSLGCVLFECLAGAPAFPGEESVSVLAQVLFGHTPEVSDQRPELPEELDPLLERLLSRSRRLRPYATVELAMELASWLASPLRELLDPVPAQPLKQGRRERPVNPTVVQTLAGETAAGSHERPSVALLGPKAVRERERRPRSTPPQPRGPWVGRSAELADVCARLERDRGMTIWGGAGVGKTRLALEVARALGTVHPQQVPVFCELGEARDSADVLRIVSERAGLPLAAHREAELVLGGLLGKLGEVLLVLDRCEHLAGELPALVALWLDAAPGLSVLATSRSRLRGFAELELAPLATREPALQLSATNVPLSEAAELVLARTGADLTVTGETRELAERIASALDGNPLAIELAAARVPVLGLAGVVARLPEQLMLLADHSASQTMRGAIAWSWDLLSEPERLAFMQCAVFRGSFTLSAAEVVIVCAEGASVLEVVQALREQSLLMSTPLAGSSVVSVRLTLSAALREFALAQLASARAQYPQLAEVETRHARYYAALAQAHVGSRVRAGLLQEPRSLERREHDNLLAAAAHLLELQEPVTAATILFALEPAILALGVTSPLVALLERTLAALDTVAAAAEAVAKASPPAESDAGPVFGVREKLAERSPASRDVALLAVTTDSEFKFARARLRALRARLLAPSGELAIARTELERACREAESARDPWLIGVTSLELGVVHHFTRELDLAAECYERALSSLADADDPVAEARCHGNLGAVAHDQGRMHEAADGYRQAIALLADANEPRLSANFRGNLALLEHEHRQFDIARTLYEQAALELEDACDARVLGIVLGNWGTLELAAERRRLTPRPAPNPLLGSPAATESLPAPHADRAPRVAARSESHAGAAAEHRAYSLFSRAHALLEGCGDRRSLGLAAARLAVVHALEGRIDDAESHLTRAERQLRRDPLAKIIAACLRGFLELARALRFVELHNSTAATASFQRARARYEAALKASHAGRLAIDQSDDLRLYSALLVSELDRTKGSLESSTQAAG